ncbi:histidinol-phosphate transaminase [Neptunitalea lumnitzerae]|uniref:Histidinol-phosphate aminotransferase n=1 Tax=Neptunitalea lumnitzerae TaxID=2965509 RepID=A0ABQ5MKS5_9FLAO|nr:histidinol-phosphate transaminase [Neptunitalea sp. Y10]GLB49655.1 histidinol-phosphate aminotransferase [Neptunitalea sp. Y10]
MSKQFNLYTLVRKNIASLKAYSSARDEYTATGSDMIFLDANENPFENGVNRYPDPYQRTLKKAIGELKQCTEEQILLGNGSDEVLDLIFRAFCEPGTDSIITLPPTYGMYKVLADLNDVKNKEVLLTHNFQPNVSAMLEATDSTTKLLFICSPNNPTGNSFTKENIQEILESFPGIVVVDEAYIDFSKDKSWITQLANYPNLIVTQTLSKAYGMAGIRLGICFASKEIISLLNKIKPPYNVNELTQKKALQQVLNDVEVQKQIQVLLNERFYLEEELRKLDFVKEVFKTDANFILVRVDNAEARYNQFLERGIVIRNRTTQPLCENTLRITVGTPEENKKVLNILKELK